MKNVQIFIADEIDVSGILMCIKKGFHVVKCYGLSDNGLLNYISKNIHKDFLHSALIIRSVRKADRSFISKLSRTTNVRLICTASSGFDNIDVGYCKQKGIEVLNVPEGNFVSAAEHTIGLILTITKNICSANYEMKNNKFSSGEYKNTELNDKVIGIIGVGRVGSHVAKIARGFGMKILGNDIDRSLPAKYPWIKFTGLKALLRESYIVTVHTPLDETTKNLLGTGQLKLMKKESILINCARGGIVNEKALMGLLKKNRIYYAGIDVFENEPNVEPEFSKLTNVVLTPHLAGKTIESRKRISVQLAERIAAYYK